MTPFEEAVKAYLNSPREWLPHCALQHAERKYVDSTTDMERRYWHAIINIEKGRLQSWLEKNNRTEDDKRYWQTVIKLAKAWSKP
jgi:predicted metal-dependent hydrolase